MFVVVVVGDVDVGFVCFVGVVDYVVDYGYV